MSHEQMDFSSALIALKDGYRLQRGGWNGKGMFAFYNAGSSFSAEQSRSEIMRNYRTGMNNMVRFRPSLYLCAADGTFGQWTPSTTDILADDWSIVR